MAVSVPAQYQGWVNTAAKGTGLPASVVAAQINEESGFNPRATSPTGAQGIAQFEPGTWKSQGVAGSPYDPNAALQGYIKLMGSLLNQFGGNVKNALAAYNAGPGNLGAGMGYANTILSNAGGGVSTVKGSGLPGVPGSTSVTQQVPTFNQAGYNQAQAKFIAGQAVSEAGGSSNPFNASPGSTKGFAQSLGNSSPLFAKGLLTTSAPNAANYQGTKTETLQVATKALQSLAGQGLTNVHPGAQGYVNPIPGAVLGRTDQGVDANLKVGAPIRAIGDSKVLGISPNWYKGQPYVSLQLLNGPQAGKIYYVAEQISPSVQAGQTLKAGQTIGTYAPSGTGIEIGWGAPGGKTEAQATTGYTEGQQTQAGQSFRSFLGSLGA